MDYLYIDLETSGLSDNAAVLQIAMIPVVDGERKEPFMMYCKPHHGAEMDPKAFEVTKIDPKKIDSFPDPRFVISEMQNYLNSFETVFNLAGHNVQFDRKKLFRFFCKHGEYSSFLRLFSNQDICTLKLSRIAFKNKRKKPDSFSLESMCKWFDIQLDNAHDALFDIKATIELFSHLDGMLSKESVEDNLSYNQKREKYSSVKYYSENCDGDIYISSHATKDPVAMRFILNELWRKYGENSTFTYIQKED